VMPLRIATLLGVVATSVAGLMMVGYPIARFVIGSNWPPGFTTLTVLLTLSIGINSLLLGVIGEYLARMYQHLKLSPKVIIETSVSAEPSAECDPSET
jgi:hypothetical protein